MSLHAFTTPMLVGVIKELVLLMRTTTPFPLMILLPFSLLLFHMLQFIMVQKVIYTMVLYIIAMHQCYYMS